MAPRTLVHDLLILSLDQATRRQRKVQEMRFGINGAALAELALLGRLAADGRKLVVADPTPIGVPVLDRVLARLAGDRGRWAQTWMTRLGRAATDDALADLQRFEIVTCRQRRFLFLPYRQYLLLDERARARLVEELTRLVDGGTPGDPRDVALLGLILAMRLQRYVLPGVPTSRLKQRLREFENTGSYAPAVRRAVDAARDAARALQSSAS